MLPILIDIFIQLSLIGCIVGVICVYIAWALDYANHVMTFLALVLGPVLFLVIVINTLIRHGVLK